MKRKYVWNVILVLIACMAFVVTGCSNTQNPNIVVEEENNSTQALSSNPVVTMVIKDYGTIMLELYPEMAPNTVNNFVTLANDGFYDGLTFHRIIQGFMIQGGDPDGVGSGGPGYTIAGEFASNGYSENTLIHTKGVISMARTKAPNSAGSQFFIMSADAPHLDNDYAAFGVVTSGIEIVEAIEQVATNSSSKPLNNVIIESVTVDTHGEAVPEVVKTK